MTTRRELFKGIAAAAVAVPFPGHALAAPAAPCASPRAAWARGIEGQRKADLGDGTYLNPIVAGDHPDPTLLKDGDDYYMTFSSFHSYPGLVIWHSTDLVNWAPMGPTLQQNLGDIWAVDLCKHDGRYFIYIPANPTGNGWSIFVIWADDIAGPWSDPIDLKIHGSIDPGHVVGEDGRRYLFVNGIRMVRLTDDGLATDGELVDSYRPWRYPDHWITENFAPEGPKLLWREGWLYLITAVGGTAGPPTGHMVIAARSRSVHGPWDHCPSNPLVRTLSNDEPWWSRGHATVVEGPAGDWWMVYHGYENGFRTRWVGSRCWSRWNGRRRVGCRRRGVICRSHWPSRVVGRLPRMAMRCRVVSARNAWASNGVSTSPGRRKCSAFFSAMTRSSCLPPVRHPRTVRR